MTSGQMKWLKFLRDNGPALRNRGQQYRACYLNGWTEWVTPGREERITESGLMALADAERAAKGGAV